MTSHFTGGGPQSSWGPPPHIFATNLDRNGLEFVWCAQHPRIPKPAAVPTFIAAHCAGSVRAPYVHLVSPPLPLPELQTHPSNGHCIQECGLQKPSGLPSYKSLTKEGREEWHQNIEGPSR